MAAYRNVFSLIVAIALLQVAGGLLGVVVPLGLRSMGQNNTIIGIIAGVYSAGFMLGAIYAPQMIRQIGNIRVFAFAAALAGVSTLLLGLFHDPWLWSAARFIQGAGIALMFASSESWMTEATPSRQRGSVLGIYHVVAKLALIGGPFLAAGYAPDAFQPMVWCGLFLVAALIPICVTRQAQPMPPGTEPYPISRMFDTAPAAVIGVFVAGFSNTGFMALLPIFAEQAGSGSVPEVAARLMAAAFLGGVISQFPAGILSDRIDRRLVVAGMGLLSALSAAGLFVFGKSPDSLLSVLLIGLWGAGALSFYGLCVAHAADRTEPNKTARMMSGLLFVWATGSVIGPIFFGVVMTSSLGTRGLFIMEILMGVALAGVMVWRRGTRAPVAVEDRESFEPVQPTSLPAVEIDPRTDSANPV